MQGNFKNHSMRKATCTRLFRKGVDPQLIKEQTGHKSEAVMLYKKSNLQQKKEVSDMLSVLPREMEEIRSSQSEMLAREVKVAEFPKLAYYTVYYLTYLFNLNCIYIMLSKGT